MNISPNVNEHYSGLSSKTFDNMTKSETATKIDRNIVHKHNDENVFIGDIHQTSPDTFECKMLFDLEHKFFFEHRIDHVPGLLILESTRQMGTAICHLFYGIDYNYYFIIDFSNILFKNFTELNTDIIVRTVIEPDTRKKNRQIFTGKSYVIQNELIIAEVESTWRCLHKRLWDKLRTK